jgi:hypothetical protein
MSGEGMTAMSHESHGLCFCAVGNHCGGPDDCDPYWPGKNGHADD